MDVSLCRVCSLGVVLHVLLPHLAAAFTLEKSWLDSLRKRQDLSGKPAESEGSGAAGAWTPHGERRAPHTDNVHTRYDTRLSDQQLQTVIRGSSNIAWGDGDSNDTEPWTRLFDSPAVFTQPRRNTLPDALWLGQARPTPAGLGSRVTAQDDDGKAVQVHPGHSLIPSHPRRLRTVLSNCNYSCLHRRASVEGASAGGGDLLQTKYRTPASVERNTYPIPARRAETPDHPAFPATTSGWLQAGSRRAADDVAPTKDLHQSLTRNPFNAKRPDVHAGPHYDDYQAPYPPLVDVSMRPAPPYARLSTLPSTSPPRAVYTRVPTAAPHPMGATPTAAPVRKPVPHSPGLSNQGTLTTTYPVPTVAKHGVENPGILQAVNAFYKRTTDVAAATTVDSGYQGVRPLETVCLQYLSVEHDIDCSQRVRRDVLSTQHLTLLLQHHGGSASTPFTAPTLREAKSSFRNLMPLGSPDTDELTHLKFTAHQIETWLEKDHATKGGWQSVPPGAPGNENGDKEVSGQSRPHRQRAAPDGSSSEDGGEVPEQTQQPPAAFLQGLALAQHMVFNSTVRRTKRAFNEADRQSYACGCQKKMCSVRDRVYETCSSSESVNCHQFDSSVCLNGQTEMSLDDNGCDTCRCTERIAGYCLNLTGQTAAGGSPHANLCTQCQQTRFLGNDVFPSYIQEVICHPDNAPCLDIGQHGPQGVCRETHIPVSVLHRNAGRCMRVNLANGQSLLFDDWRLSQRMVRTGCQCMIDKRSPVAAMLNS